MVLAGAKMPREQADPVPVAALVNAAASEVEDYTRVVTATVPDSEIVGAVAGDLVHLLAELLDNALRYSPPISQVRVSAVHTGNGGAGPRGQRHRAGHDRIRSACRQHPPAVRWRGQPVHRATHGSVRGRPARHPARPGGPAAQHHRGRTGLGHHRRGVRAGRAAARAGSATSSTPARRAHAADAHPGMRHRNGPRRRRRRLQRLRRIQRHGDEVGADQLNGHSELPVTLLPQRSPGASGISGSRPRRLARSPSRCRARGRVGDEPASNSRRRRPSTPPRSSPPRPGVHQRRRNQRAMPDTRAGAEELPQIAPRRNPRRRSRRHDLSEDAVRVAGRSARAGQQHRPELEVGLGQRLVGGRGCGERPGARPHTERPARARARRPAGARRRGRAAGRASASATAERTPATAATTR